MQKVAKGFLIGLGAVLGLAALGTLGLNLYVQSAGTQARLERELSTALGSPVHLTGTMLTPWGGLKITGVTVPQPAGAGNFLESPSCAASFEFWPLLHRQLVLDELTINDPKVAWIQDSGGNWRLPGAKPERKNRPEATPAPTPETARTKPATPFLVSVKHLQIEHGVFDFFDRKNRHVVSFGEVQGSCSPVSAPDTEGLATSRQVNVRDAIFLDNLRAPFRFRDDLLSIHALSADLAGGSVGGEFQLDTARKHSPFTVDVTFERVALERLLAEAKEMPGKASGSLAGWLDLYGQAGDAESIGGSGRVTLKNGILQFDLFQSLGLALQIGDLIKFNAQQAEADFHVGQQRVFVDDLLLRSANLKLTAHGAVEFGGELRLDARLTINQRINAQLPGFIAQNFQPGDEPGTRVVDFVIDGTISHPHTDLVDHIIGGKLQQEFGGLWNALTGKRKPEKKEKKPKTKTDKTAPAMTPEASPAASPNPGTAE